VDGTTTVTLKDGTVIEGFDCVLWAIGRHPVTGGLGLQEAGVALDKGFVVVDEYENTNVSETAHPLFTPCMVIITSYGNMHAAEATTTPLMAETSLFPAPSRAHY